MPVATRKFDEIHPLDACGQGATVPGPRTEWGPSHVVQSALRRWKTRHPQWPIGDKADKASPLFLGSCPQSVDVLVDSDEAGEALRLVGEAQLLWTSCAGVLREQVSEAVWLSSFAEASVYHTVMAASSIDIPRTAGATRPITVITKPGTVTHVVMPGASSMRGVTGYRLSDVMNGALAQLIPHRVPAAGEGGSTLAFTATNLTPVNGMPSISRTAGTRASRARLTPEPSAKLKTKSGGSARTFRRNS